MPEVSLVVLLSHLWYEDHPINEVLAVHLQLFLLLLFLLLCFLLQGLRFIVLLTNREPTRIKGSYRAVLLLGFLYVQVWRGAGPPPSVLCGKVH